MPLAKWQVAQIWRAYQQREGPKNLGAVEWPKPRAGCLDGLKFLSTGVYETIDRDELVDLIRKSGGRYYSGMSVHLDYLLVGRDAGPVKLKTAEENGITQLSEEEFYNFINDKINNYDPNVPVEKPEKVVKKKQPVKKPAKTEDNNESPERDHKPAAKKEKVAPKAKKEAKTKVKKEPKNNEAVKVKKEPVKRTVVKREVRKEVAPQPKKEAKTKEINGVEAKKEPVKIKKEKTSPVKLTAVRRSQRGTKV